MVEETIDDNEAEEAQPAGSEETQSYSQYRWAQQMADSTAVRKAERTAGLMAAPWAHQWG